MTTATAWPATLERITLLNRANTFEVWDCWDNARVCRVVVKTLREDRAGDERAIRQLMGEGTLLEDLRHPHILRAYETNREPVPMIVMETLGGETLARMIDEAGHLQPEEIAHLGLQLSSALAQLHGRGLIHLDLKPSNVIGDGGRARLIDLGLASPFGDGRAELGTWCYMSPEQVSGKGLGPATDVWGLGAILFECINGHPPFDDPELDGLDSSYESAPNSSSAGARPDHYPQLQRSAVLTGPGSGVNPGLDRLTIDCLNPDPGVRPTLAAFAARLEDVLELAPQKRRYSRSIRK